MEGVEECVVIEVDEMKRDEDVETSNIARDPKLPTTEQDDEHNYTHVIFRDWCYFHRVAAAAISKT